MQDFFRTHKKAKWTGILVLGLLLAIGIFLSFFD